MDEEEYGMTEEEITERANNFVSRIRAYQEKIHRGEVE